VSPKHSTSSDPSSSTPGPVTPVVAGAPQGAVVPEQPSIGTLVSEASSSLSTLLHGEIELAKLEVKASVKNAGTGAGLFAAAGVLLVFSLTFGLIALAEGLVAAHMWRWAAYLIVFGVLVFIAAIAVLLGIRKVKRVKAPTQTIETTKASVNAVKRAATSS
jgi:uncharacterized membrane protein YqjE